MDPRRRQHQRQPLQDVVTIPGRRYEIRFALSRSPGRFGNRLLAKAGTFGFNHQQIDPWRGMRWEYHTLTVWVLLAGGIAAGAAPTA